MANNAYPGISVIIPAYNYARYLPFAIESVLAQDYPLFELIVVDDGSTDDTRQIAAQYGDKLRYIHQENAGLSATRNTGIRHARYDLISLLDADDVWQPGILTKLQATLSDLPAEYGMVACLQLNIDAEGNMLPVKHARRFEQHSREITIADMLLKTRFGPSCVLVRKECFYKCGMFDTQLNSSEDRDMWLRIAASYRIHLLAEELTLVRKHISNMSRHSDRMKINMGKVLGQAFRADLYPRHKIYFWLRVWAHFRHETACMYFDEGRRGQAIVDELVSIASCPVFINPDAITERPFFRLRHLWYFCKGKEQPQQGGKSALGINGRKQKSEQNSIHHGAEIFSHKAAKSAKKTPD